MKMSLQFQNFLFVSPLPLPLLLFFSPSLLPSSFFLLFLLSASLTLSIISCVGDGTGSWDMRDAVHGQFI